MLTSDIPTPALLVDRQRLMSNISRTQGRADREGVSLRPHIKTHKCPDLARLQVEAGAKGITVATISEAEAFAAAGFDDLVIAREVVDPNSFERIAALMEASIQIAFCVDTVAGSEAASTFFSARGLPVDVFVEVDVGHGRCGIDWDDLQAAEFVRQIQAMPGLHVQGLLTHGGHGYHGPQEGETKEAALKRGMMEERDRLLHLASRLRYAGLLDPAEAVLSLGSTPTFSCFENADLDGFRITEARPGNYAFNDAIQEALGVCPLTHCALTALATVISIHRDDGVEQVFVDAGKKVLTSDKGYALVGFGVVLHSPSTMKPMPHARMASLSEEHGWIEIPGGSPFEVGDRVRIVPNHACVAVATRPTLFVVEGDEVVAEWSVVGR